MSQREKQSILQHSGVVERAAMLKRPRSSMASAIPRSLVGLPRRCFQKYRSGAGQRPAPHGLTAHWLIG